MVDEMDFGSLGEKKRAIFCVIPIADTSMNYLVGMLYFRSFITGRMKSMAVGFLFQCA